MNTEEFLKKSEWIMASDVKEGTTVAILDEGERHLGNFGPVLRIRVENKELGIRWLKVNQFTLRNFHQAWGFESKNWIGKKALLNVEVFKNMPTVVGVPVITDIKEEDLK